MTKKKPTLSVWWNKGCGGQWAKKYKGKLYTLGKDKVEALREIARIMHCVDNGIDPHQQDADHRATGLPLQKYLIDWFAKKAEKSEATLDECKSVNKMIKEVVDINKSVRGVTDEDVKAINERLARYSKFKRRNYGRRVREVLKYCNSKAGTRIDTDWIYIPSQAELDLVLEERDPMIWERENVIELLRNADPKFRAMFLLGLNIGLDNKECWVIERKFFNLPSERASEPMFIKYMRKKTSKKREGAFWPETINAILDHIETDPFRSKSDLMFVNSIGNKYTSSQLSKEFLAFRKKCNVTQDGTFKWFRKTFRAVAEETEDETACDAAMGHTSSHVRDFYLPRNKRKRDKRLMKVSDCVRDWLKPQEILNAK